MADALDPFRLAVRGSGPAPDLDYLERMELEDATALREHFEAWLASLPPRFSLGVAATPGTELHGLLRDAYCAGHLQAVRDFEALEVSDFITDLVDI